MTLPGAGAASLARQPPRVLALDIRQARIVRQVGPFVGIVAVVVELLGAVGVSDVSPSLRADRVVPAVVGGDGRPGAGGVGILELRDEAVALQAAAGRQAAELDERRDRGRATPPGGGRSSRRRRPARRRSAGPGWIAPRA